MSEMNTNPLVSVIVPVYNVAPYLRQCLDSICGQTLKDIEIILVDDGSTDESLSILQEYAARDSRITVLQQQNQYAGAARQKGMEIAKGKYYSFVDSDDFFELNMLEEMTNKAEKHGADIVVCNADVYREAENRITSAPWLLRMEMLGGTSPELFSPMDVIGDKIYHFVRLTPWGKIFRASFVKQHNLHWQSLSRANDVLFVGSALALAKSMSAIDTVYVHYRARANSTAHSSKRSETALIEAYSALKANLTSLNAPEQALHAANVSLLSILVYDMTRLEGATAQRLLEYVKSDVEPNMHLLNLPEYENPYIIQEDYSRYKALVCPSISVVLRESVGKNVRELEAHLKMLLSIKDVDFEIICVSHNTQSETHRVFQRFANLSLACKHILVQDSGNIGEYVNKCKGCILVDTLTTSANSKVVREVLKKVRYMPYLPYEVHKFEYLQELAAAAPDKPLKRPEYNQLLEIAKSTPKVSIIVPVYRAKEHISTTLTCLKYQTLKEIELIFVDDKGCDGTFDVLRRAAEEDPRIICIENAKNSGPGASRNNGIRHARGRYIAFVDADDVLPLNFYELLYNKAVENNLKVVKGSARIVSQDGAAFNTTLNKFIESNISKYKSLLNLFRYDHWTAIFDRELVLSSGAVYAEDINRGEDNHYLMMLCHHVSVKEFAIVPEAVYYYIQHKSSIVHSFTGAVYLSAMKKSLTGRMEYILNSCPDTHDTREYVSGLFEGMLSWIYVRGLSEGGVDIKIAFDYLSHVAREFARWQKSKREIKQRTALSQFIKLNRSPLSYLIYHYYSQNIARNTSLSSTEASVLENIQALLACYPISDTNTVSCRRPLQIAIGKVSFKLWVKQHLSPNNKNVYVQLRKLCSEIQSLFSK